MMTVLHDDEFMKLQAMNHDPGLPNCMMLHKNLMVAWDSFPPQLTITLAGHISEDEYMAFGVSGEQVTISFESTNVKLLPEQF